MVALGAPLPPPAGRQGPSLLTTLGWARKTSETLVGFQESSLVLGAEKAGSDRSRVHKKPGLLASWFRWDWGASFYAQQKGSGRGG